MLITPFVTSNGTPIVKLYVTGDALFFSDVLFIFILNYLDSVAVYVIPPYEANLYSISWLLALYIDTPNDDVAAVDIGLRTF